MRLMIIKINKTYGDNHGSRRNVKTSFNTRQRRTSYNGNGATDVLSHLFYVIVYLYTSALLIDRIFFSTL